MIKIAHISDLHVRAPDPVPLSRFMNKRVTGAVNLYTFRKGAHSTQILTQLVDDILAMNVDHTCITGDLTNLSLESEFAAARKEIERLGDGREVSIVPGNHDIYTQGSRKKKRFETFFGKWLHPDSQDLPYSKPIGEGVRVTGLCSAVPTLPFTSYGRLPHGTMSTAQLNHDLEDFELVLLHHNLHPRSSALKDWSSGLRGRDEFLRELFQRKSNVVLHGHTHVSHRVKLSTEEHFLHILGCGSSTWTEELHPARYCIYHIDEKRLQKVETRIYNQEQNAFLPVPGEESIPENPGWFSRIEVA